MGVYSEYLSKGFTFDQLNIERKIQLKKIAQIRGGRDILVYASDIQNRQGAPVSIDFSDIQPFKDQISNLKGSAIDIILETPGGIGEVVEDLIKLVRSKYDDLAVIIPGTAKSAGTIFSMAGDDILMSSSSSLGPIDAQMMSNNKRFSADAFLEGLEKIKKEVASTGRLNPAYIPILQNISPGEIQNCENAQNFSKTLVRDWLQRYKFAKWTKHSSTGLDVTEDEKKNRAFEIAEQLCKHSDWLTHGRSVKIEDLEKMGLKISNYEINTELNDAITRYYTLLQITLESTNMYKLFETTETQIMRFTSPQVNTNKENKPANVVINYDCPSCKSKYEIQARLENNVPVNNSMVQFPKNDIFVCPKCSSSNNLSTLRLQLEAQTGKKVL
ncbi:MAG: Clp protease ClpP [Brumimicrobium sp.]|nr:Clp protease ClpP [Brumimicrobium sp.]